MATEINCSCEITENEVTICYPPISSGGGGGITGVGSVNFLTKIVTLEGADGSAIVTVGNSMAYDDGTGFYIKNNLGTDVSTLGVLPDNYGFTVIKNAGNNSSFSAFYNAVQSQVISGGVVVSRFQVDDTHIVLTSPDIVDGYIAAFQYNGVDGFNLISLPYPTGGGTTTNPLTIGTGLTGTSFDGSAPITIAIDSSVATLTGSQALSNKTGNISQWTNDSGYLTSLSGAVTSVAGTAGRITSSGGAAPIIDIDAAYVGQASITTLGTIGAGVWQGAAIADAYISSAATWNAKESALTFSTGLTRATNTITNNLSTGVSGGQTLIGGTAAGDKLVIEVTSNATHTAARDLITLRKNSAAAASTSILMTIGDGQGLNNDEVSIYTGNNSGTNGYLLRAGATFAYFNASSSLRLQIAAADIIQLSSSTATMVQGITISDAKNIVLNTTTGTKIGTATSQKLALWNKTPIAQPTTGITGATLTGGGGSTITSTDTFGGYTLQQLAAIIINTGLAA